MSGSHDGDDPEVRERTSLDTGAKSLLARHCARRRRRRRDAVAAADDAGDAAGGKRRVRDFVVGPGHVALRRNERVGRRHLRRGRRRGRAARPPHHRRADGGGARLWVGDVVARARADRRSPSAERLAGPACASSRRAARPTACSPSSMRRSPPTPTRRGRRRRRRGRRRARRRPCRRDGGRTCRSTARRRAGARRRGRRYRRGLRPGGRVVRPGERAAASDGGGGVGVHLARRAAARADGRLLRRRERLARGAGGGRGDASQVCTPREWRDGARAAPPARRGGAARGGESARKVRSDQAGPALGRARGGGGGRCDHRDAHAPLAQWHLPAAAPAHRAAAVGGEGGGRRELPPARPARPVLPHQPRGAVRLPRARDASAGGSRRTRARARRSASTARRWTRCGASSSS